MSNWIKLQLLLSVMLLNYFKRASVLRHWLNCSFSIMSEFIFSTSCLLTFQSSFLMDLLNGTLNWNESCLCHLWVSQKQVFLQLHQTLKFAKQHTNIDKNDLRIINHCRKSLLFSDNKTWKKKTTDSCFDDTIGIWWSRICGLVGLYIQSKLEEVLPKSNRWPTFIKKS